MEIVFFVFRIHFHTVLSYLFGLFGVRTCVSILWHTSLPKNATFAWKNSEKPWFWRFLVIFVFLTWRHLWCHSDVIQGMFVLFWYQWTREGHSYPLVPHGFRDLRGGGIRPPPPRLWDGSKKPGSFRVNTPTDKSDKESISSVGTKFDIGSEGNLFLVWLNLGAKWADSQNCQVSTISIHILHINLSLKWTINPNSRS